MLPEELKRMGTNCETVICFRQGGKMPNTRNAGLAWLQAKGNNSVGITKVSRYYTPEIARSGVPGWWFEFPETAFNIRNGYINLLCQTENGQNNFYQLRVPNLFLKTQKRNLAFRADKRVYSLHLSGKRENKFIDVRGSGKIDLAPFRV